MIRTLVALFAAAPLMAAAFATPLLAAVPAKPQSSLVPSGDPVNCISLSNIRSTKVVDGSTVDFTMNGNRVFRNHLPNACPGLSFDQSFAYAPTNNQLCNVDTITVIRQGGGPMRGATCGLGQFTPMKKAASSQ